MSIPTDRLREIATGAVIDLVERVNIATELLACREGRALFESTARELGATCIGCPGCSSFDCAPEAVLRAVASQRDAARAELAAVKRQRDGMVAIAADLRERVRGVRILYDTCKSTEPLRVAIDCYEEVAKRIEALAAEQPKPQQPEVQP